MQNLNSELRGGGKILFAILWLVVCFISFSARLQACEPQSGAILMGSGHGKTYLSESHLELLSSNLSICIGNESSFGDPMNSTIKDVIPDLFVKKIIDSANECFIFTSVAPLPGGGYRICFSSLFPSATHQWTLVQFGVGVVGNSTNSSDCFTITGGGNGFALNYYMDGNICSAQSFQIPNELECSNQSIIAEIDTCDFIASIELFGFEGDFPIVVDHGDGSAPEIISSDTWEHQYPLNIFTTYNLCITYSTPTAEEDPKIQTCCYPVAIICCDTADFEFEQVVAFPQSCINPMFQIESHCVEDVIAQHYWFFSDGKTYEGPYPPSPYRFSDFVNDTGFVCITHMVVCCEDTSITKKCLPHPKGAYLGKPGEERKLSDPILPWATSVYHFMHDLADNLEIPLLIDGTIIVDQFATFDNTTTVDYWNMGNGAIIRNIGNSISLTRVNVHSASRLNPILGRSYNCCRWVGFESDKRTTFRFRNDTISDANFMLHYNGDQTPTSPTLWAENNFFHTNLFCIKSIAQNLNISRFHGNKIVGVDHDLILCDCSAINAIDFRGMVFGPNIPVRFPQTGSVNTISRYEQGFHFDNASLIARNFYIDSLQNYDDVLQDWDNLTDSEAAIGIHFVWSRPIPSSLDIDDFYFENFSSFGGASSIAVYDSVAKGHHTLTGIASDPLTSIVIDNIVGGYKIRNGGTIHGVISGNLFETTGFGVNGSVLSSGNTMRIEGNTINNNGGSSPTGGITLSSLTIPSITQNFQVRNNYISNNSDGGSGIFIDRANMSLVEHNLLEESSSQVDGIVLSRAHQSELRCNMVSTFRNAIQSDLSESSHYTANYIDYNRRSMVFTGDNNGTNGSIIRWNTFSLSYNPDIQYNSMDAITGPQLHTMYNSWEDQNGVELHHVNTSGIPALNCRFYYPSGAIIGSVHRPEPNLISLQQSTFNAAQNLPTGYCSELVPHEDDGGGQLTEPIDNGVLPDTFYASLLVDTSLWSNISPAQGDALKQRIMKHLYDNPAWISSHVVLEDFFEDEDTTFIGRSVAIEQEIESILTIQDSFLSTLSPSRLVMDSLSVLVDSLFQLAAETSNPTTKAGLLAQGTAISNELDTLAEEMATISTLFYTFRDSLIGDLKTLNDNLQDNSLHKLYEKTINAILIHIWQDSSLTSTQKDDLRDIAEICYDDGGRAVYNARGLCWTLLNEYYHEDSCQAYIAPRIVVPGNNGSVGVHIHPNPANNWVSILMDESWKEETIDIIITDMAGRTMQQHRGIDGAIRRMDLRSDQLHNGNYIIVLQGKVKSESIILSIQR